MDTPIMWVVTHTPLKGARYTARVYETFEQAWREQEKLMDAGCERTDIQPATFGKVFDPAKLER